MDKGWPRDWVGHNMARLGITEVQARCLAGDLAEFGRDLIARQNTIIKGWQVERTLEHDQIKADAGDFLIAQCEKVICEMETIAKGQLIGIPTGESVNVAPIRKGD